jgi:hypothetical protein
MDARKVGRVLRWDSKEKEGFDRQNEGSFWW